MSKIDLRLLTLAANPPRPGAVLVWNSDSGILTTNVNLYDIYDELLIREHEIARNTLLVNQAIADVSRALALNQTNTNTYNECLVKLSGLADKISNTRSIVIDDIKVCDTFLETQLLVKEAQATQTYHELTDYINQLGGLKVQHYSLLSRLAEAEVSISQAETDVYQFQDKVQQLEVEIKDVEHNLKSLNGKVIALAARVNPTVYDILELKKFAASVTAQLTKILARASAIEAQINKNLGEICGMETAIAQVAVQKERLSEKAATLNSLAATYREKINQIECDLGMLYVKSIDSAAIAKKVSMYLERMIAMINGGLLEAGENVQIEYNRGFAIIHVNLPEYEARVTPPRDCFDSAPIELTYPAPNCPPVIPDCPSICPPITCEGSECGDCPQQCPPCPETTTTTTTVANSTTTTTTVANTTTTTTTEAPGCYLAICCFNAVVSDNISLDWTLANAACSGYAYPAKVGYLCQIISAQMNQADAEAKASASACLGRNDAHSYVVNVDGAGIAIRSSGGACSPLDCSFDEFNMKKVYIPTKQLSTVIQPGCSCVWASASSGATCSNPLY